MTAAKGRESNINPWQAEKATLIHDRHLFDPVLWPRMRVNWKISTSMYFQYSKTATICSQPFSITTATIFGANEVGAWEMTSRSCCVILSRILFMLATVKLVRIPMCSITINASVGRLRNGMILSCNCELFSGCIETVFVSEKIHAGDCNIPGEDFVHSALFNLTLLK